MAKVKTRSAAEELACVEKELAELSKKKKDLVKEVKLEAEETRNTSLQIIGEKVVSLIGVPWHQVNFESLNRVLCDSGLLSSEGLTIKEDVTPFAAMNNAKQFLN